jgi:hypothetical protein
MPGRTACELGDEMVRTDDFAYRETAIGAFNLSRGVGEKAGDPLADFCMAVEKATLPASADSAPLRQMFGDTENCLVRELQAPAKAAAHTAGNQ